MRENSLMIRVENVKKQYRLGQIGGGTLRGDLQSWWARKRGKEDPNTLIGTDQRLIGTTFMALNGVSFTVNKGEAVGIIGSNGAGKSTLLKLLTHVTAPTSGDIDLYGRVASMLEVGTGFHPEMTGRENVYLNGAILGMTRAEIDAKMAEIIEFSEVGDFIDTPVKRYSSGMFVKLAFSVAAHLDSEIMIMDEVLAVGDMKFQKKCLTKMRQAARRDGKTVLYVSHNMATIRDLCDRCIVLDKGKVIFDGDVDEGIALYLSTKSQEADPSSTIPASSATTGSSATIIRLQCVRAARRRQSRRIERTASRSRMRYRVHVKAQAVGGTCWSAAGGARRGRQPAGQRPASMDLNLHARVIATFTAQYDLSVLARQASTAAISRCHHRRARAARTRWRTGCRAFMFRMVDTFTKRDILSGTRRTWGSIRAAGGRRCARRMLNEKGRCTVHCNRQEIRAPVAGISTKAPKSIC